MCLALLLPLLLPTALPQESAALLDAPLVTLGFEDRYGVLVDFDQDGFLDAVSWWYLNGYTGGAELSGWHNDGEGRFTRVWTTSIDVPGGGGTPHALSVRIYRCNLDSDGLEDFYLVFSELANLAVRAFRSRGLEAPELMSPYSVGWGGDVYRMHAVVTDFTGDGLADMAYTVNWRLRVMEFVPGEPSLVARSDTWPFGFIGPDLEGLIEIDANGDDTPDLMTWNGSTVKLIEIQDCQPAATQTFTQGIVEDHMPAVGDIDGDGDEDVVIWDMTRYVVGRRTGAATWSFEPPKPGGPAEYLVDVDGDGDLDGVCCGGGPPSSTNNIRPSTLRISLNDGAGAFAPALERSWLGSDHLAGIVDIDHDGDLDVLAGRCILYGRGSLVDELFPPLGVTASERSTADIDGDSDPDYGVGMQPIARNLGAGPAVPHEPSFPDDPGLAGPGWPGDFDGDGDLDLIVKRRAGPTLLGQHLLRNQGGGAFVDAGLVGEPGVDFLPDVAGADEAESSLAADVDGDGDLDLVTRSAFSGPRISRVWWNRGAAGFERGPVFHDEVVRAIADLDGDGLPDVVGVTTSLGWHAGYGGGNFGPFVPLEPLDAYLDRFALADLDSDGDLDFATPSNASSTLQLHWNQGNGLFDRQTEFAIGFGALTGPPRRVSSADLDLDGRPELLITPALFEPNGVRILERRANNLGWKAPFSQVVFQHDGTNGIVLEAVLRDADGDLDVDFLTDRLIRNGAYSPPEGGARRQTLSGTAGTGGLVPTLGARGPFRPGETAELRITGGLGGAQGEITVYLTDAGVRTRGAGGSSRAHRILARIPIQLDGPAGEAGRGSFTHTFVVPQSVAGRTVGHHAAIVDPAAPDGYARTNGLWLDYGE